MEGIQIKGKHAEAKIMTEQIEELAMSQIINLCNQVAFKDSDIKIMPDCHAGKGCVIGFVAKQDPVNDKIIPNIIGVDIGCGVLVVDLHHLPIDLDKLDKVISEKIPAGFNVHETAKVKLTNAEKEVVKRLKLKESYIENSIGSLGGGNHFIEIIESDDGHRYLVIHSGSRKFGMEIARYHQKIAAEFHKAKAGCARYDLNHIVGKLRGAKPDAASQKLIDLYKKRIEESKVPKDLEYLKGEAAKQYIHDMIIAQEYAKKSRAKMAEIICKEAFGLQLSKMDTFESVHNYYDTKTRTIRKGAISAEKGQRLIIPLNMRDGSIIGIGKGNDEWLVSAPHGAGRLMSRSQAKKEINLEEFKEQMEGIYTTSVCQGTLDEAPGAYKPQNEIMKNIEETIEVEAVLKPIYNYKSH